MKAAILLDSKSKSGAGKDAGRREEPEHLMATPLRNGVRLALDGLMALSQDPGCHAAKVLNDCGFQRVDENGV
jgi:hypothetical protein